MRKGLMENSLDNYMMKVGHDDDSGTLDSSTCSTSPTTSTNEKMSIEELIKFYSEYSDRTDSSYELILEDKLKKVEKLRIEREEHLQRMEELREQNDTLLLEVASLKLVMASSSSSGGGGGHSNRVSVTSKNNSDRIENAIEEGRGGNKDINNGKIPRSKSAEPNDTEKSSVRRGCRRASIGVVKHDNNKQTKKIATRKRISASSKDYLLGYTAEFTG